MPAKSLSALVLPLLGALSVISPFAIDMYLPAFDDLAAGFRVSETTISLTLSSYFIGLAFGQVIYGPLLDRFGRKRPLGIGLTLFLVASVGCAFAPDIETLIALRFVQALGGCVAQVASVAMVRDFSPRDQAARVLSRLFLFVAVSPLLAPTVGGLAIEAGGWQAAFLAAQVVAGAALLIGAATFGWGLAGTLVLLAVFLGCIGITNPNASAFAIGPFTRNAGSASALLGFFQLGVGAVISTGISAATPADGLPIIAILAVTSATGLAILLAGRRRAQASAVSEHPTDGTGGSAGPNRATGRDPTPVAVH